MYIFNLLISCNDSELQSTTTSWLNSWRLPFELNIQTSATENLGSRLSSEKIDILYCDAEAFLSCGKEIFRAMAANPHICTLVVGTPSAMVKVNAFEWTQGEERLFFLQPPIRGEALQRKLRECCGLLRMEMLVDQKDKSMAFWKSAYGIVRERFWYDLLSGRMRRMAENKIVERASKLDVPIKEDGKVILILVRTEPDQPNFAEYAEENPRDRVVDLMNDIFGRDMWTAPVVSFPNGDSIIVVECNHRETISRVLRDGVRFRNNYKHLFHRDVLCSCSMPMGLKELANLTPSVATLLAQERYDAIFNYTKSDPVFRMMDYIERNISRKLNRNDIVEATVSFHPDYAAALFRKETGQSLQEYIISRKIERAKMLLCQQHQTVTSVAAEVGFANPSYFSRCFQENVGLSPSAYKKIHEY